MNQKEEVQDISSSIRQLLQKLVRKKIKTKEDREELASFLGIKPSSLPNMLYKGEGGLNLWIAALIYCYQFKIEDVVYFFENYHMIAEKTDHLDPIDREWISVGQSLSSQDKKFVLGLIKMSHQLHKDLYKEKP